MEPRNLDPLYALSPEEVAQIRGVSTELLRIVQSEDGLIAAAYDAAAELPAGMRRFLVRHRRADTPVFGVDGYEVDDRSIGPTPTTWDDSEARERTRIHELFLLMTACLLGEVHSVSSLQNGHLANDVIPIPGSEASVTAGSSTSRLVWHTEEAGFDTRADYQVFLALRNDESIPTMIASVEDLTLPEALRETLAEPRFLVAPLGDLTDDLVSLPILFGGADHPYIRLDPLATLGADPTADRALATIVAAIDSAMRPLPQVPGRVWIIDNYRCVHGRDAFNPKYDGRDRWLKRSKVVLDHRKIRPHRVAGSEYIIDIAHTAEARHGAT